MPVRLIATDIDGTLLSSDRVIPRENVDAIRAAQEKGIVVAMATGRFPLNAALLLEQYGLACPVIGINGAHIVDEKVRVIREAFMLPEAAEQVEDALESTGADFFLFGRGFICTSGENLFHHSELSDGPRVTARGIVYCHGLGEARRCARQNVYKFFVRNNVPLMILREKLREIHGIQLTQSAPDNLEVMPLGVDKGRGLRDLAASLGIFPEETMAIGDEENDIPMLAAAGYGVAMGNASRLAKAAARYVVGTNDECGFAGAVRQYALQEG